MSPDTAEAGWRTLVRVALFRELGAARAVESGGADGGTILDRLRRHVTSGDAVGLSHRSAEAGSRILYSRASPQSSKPSALTTLKAWVAALTSAEFLGNLVCEYQDKLIDLKRIRQHIGIARNLGLIHGQLDRL